jgi:hypothetical protein
VGGGGVRDRDGFQCYDDFLNVMECVLIKRVSFHAPDYKISESS